MVHPLSTGITFALTDKAPNDKIPLITTGYGRSDTADGSVFKWNFPLARHLLGAPPTCWCSTSQEGRRLDKLKGKKIALVYHDCPTARSRSRCCRSARKMHGFELLLLPVTHPGVEQKATWLQIRQHRPDYVFLWGWGVMNSTSIKEAIATGYPRDKMYGVWWAAAEPDVKDVGDGAKGYNGTGAAARRRAELPGAQGHAGPWCTTRARAPGRRKKSAGALHARHDLGDARRSRAFKQRAGTLRQGQVVMTGEQVRWGLENLTLDQKKLEALGFAGVMRPINTSCDDHGGAAWARIHTWDGNEWNFTSDWYAGRREDHQADDQGVGRQVRGREEDHAPHDLPDRART